MADRISLIADRLQQEMESWRSIELRVSTKQPLPKNPPPDVKELFIGSEQHYIETAAGQRLLDKTMMFTGGSSQRQQDFTDGQRCANLYFDQSGSRQNQIDIQSNFGHEHQHGFTDRPEPLYYFYVGKRPIYEAIRTAESLGVGRHLGRPCDLYLFGKLRLAAAPLDAVYYLDQETSLPMKVEFYRIASNRLPGSAVRIWEAKTFDSTEGVRHFPLKSQNTYFKGGEAYNFNSVTVTGIHYDRDYAASTFWPTFQPGVAVNDSIKKTFTQIPDPASPSKAQKSAAKVTPALVAPARASIAETTTVVAPAVAPWSWSSVGSSALLGLGILLVGAGVVAGWRRRN